MQPAWRERVCEVLERHWLGPAPATIAAGHNATHPTFLAGEVVVKFFGGTPSWRKAWLAESDGHRRARSDPGLLVPELLATGSLRPEHPHTPWPYLVTARMRGEPWWKAELSTVQRRRVASELGAQLKRVHALPVEGATDVAFWQPGSVVRALERSALPARLRHRVTHYVQSLPEPEPAFVHGDLVQNHCYVAEGRLCGIIDWGDAVVADRAYEIGKLHVHTFDADHTLLRDCLEAMEWEVDDDFPRRVLGRAFERQAVGLVQHRSFDLFHQVAEQVSLHEIHTLEALAMALFETRRSPSMG
ncbi:MAG: phosphotransferase [Myxococcales bacterium]|nr:phosphotransferase [Myxococcales bacterium]